MFLWNLLLHLSNKNTTYLLSERIHGKIYKKNWLSYIFLLFTNANFVYAISGIFKLILILSLSIKQTSKERHTHTCTHIW